ncbi:class I SAM-dependent methyltransferase [Sphingomonas fennica]|uniref:class I SAM-dependent methyltransferase n=1 Tax=Edaphosphingomonas fennica TaxID=114404 RepID=UPI0011B246CC|nr:class I SAM-dependent methyltransferase [Sphingomonas fennica]
MIKNRLLKDIFFGTEIEKLDAGTSQVISILNNLQDFADIDRKDWENILDIVKSFFKSPIKGRFGGPITPGDAFFMAAFLAAKRPKSVIEVGVCAGVSSAFTLYAGRKLGLLKEGRKFLHSIDLLRFHGPAKNEVGQVVRLNHPDLLPYWNLIVETTMPDAVLHRPDILNAIRADQPSLGFIDANHMHPWPLIDTLAMTRMLPKNSWVLHQDTQVMERWLANSVELGVPCPTPCRGGNLVSTLWPGQKVIGWGMCYNMAAIKLDVTSEEIRSFSENAFQYPPEVGNAEAMSTGITIEEILKDK